MAYPTVPITSLSETAQRLYNIANTSLTLDRDWLAPDAHRMSAHAFRDHLKLDPEFQPSAELMAAVGELTRAGYAWHSHTNVFGIRRVDPGYTVAFGDDPWKVNVSRVSRPGMRSGDDSVLLAVLDGAELTTRTDSGFGTPELHLKVHVPGARDVEHDPAYAASLTVQLPTFPQIYGHRVTFWGIAEEVHLYPLGTDPTLLDDHTHEPIDEPVRCDYELCQGGGEGRDPHVFAPYLPPAVDLERAVLCIEATLRKTPKKRKKG